MQKIKLQSQACLVRFLIHLISQFQCERREASQESVQADRSAGRAERARRVGEHPPRPQQQLQQVHRNEVAILENLLPASNGCLI